MPEVTLTDIDDVKNRLKIGLLEMNAETVARIELASAPPSLLPGLSIEHKPIRGPGQFEIKIIVINATLTGRIACDNGVTITPSGPPEVLGSQEITPAILEVPQSFTEGTVTCSLRTQ